MRLFKKFQCDKCEKKFSHQEDLMHHELRAHCEDSRYDCKVCNEYFDSMEAMRDHLKKKHSYKNQIIFLTYRVSYNFFNFLEFLDLVFLSNRIPMQPLVCFFSFLPQNGQIMSGIKCVPSQRSSIKLDEFRSYFFFLVFPFIGKTVPQRTKGSRILLYFSLYSI